MPSKSFFAPPPPELDWQILSTLVHLSNADKVPLPMILKVTKNTLSAKEVADETRRSSRFFTISKRGRTIADFSQARKASTSQSARLPTEKSARDDSHHEADADEQARLPNYLMNPHSSILFASREHGPSKQIAATSRRATRRRSSLFDLASSMRFSGSGGAEEEIPDFRSTTFTRAGLNIHKLRAFESESDERERQARRRIREESAAAGGESNFPIDDDVQKNHHLVSYVTPRLIAHCEDLSLYDTKHPKYPASLRSVLERRDKNNVTTSGGCKQHDGCIREDLDWVGEHPVPPLGGSSARGELVLANQALCPAKEVAVKQQPRNVVLDESAMIDQQVSSAGYYPIPPSPRRPQAHPMLRQHRKHQMDESQRRCGVSPKKCTSDFSGSSGPGAASSSVNTNRLNVLRELGGEVSLSGRTGS